MKKMSAKTRQYIEILEGKIAQKYGYKMDKNNITLGNGAIFNITTQVYNNLKNMGY